MKQVQITVFGNVQGVGFRYFTQMKAVQHNVRGWVKNGDNGSVEVLAEGTQDDLNRFIEDVRAGNPFSTVSEIVVNDANKSENYYSFKIKY